MSLNRLHCLASVWFAFMFVLCLRTWHINKKPQCGEHHSVGLMNRLHCRLCAKSFEKWKNHNVDSMTRLHCIACKCFLLASSTTWNMKKQHRAEEWAEGWFWGDKQLWVFECFYLSYVQNNCEFWVLLPVLIQIIVSFWVLLLVLCAKQLWVLSASTCLNPSNCEFLSASTCLMCKAIVSFECFCLSEPGAVCLQGLVWIPVCVQHFWTNFEQVQASWMHWPSPRW